LPIIFENNQAHRSTLHKVRQTHIPGTMQRISCSGNFWMIWKREFSNCDWKKLCNLIIYHAQSVIYKEQGQQLKMHEPQHDAVEAGKCYKWKTDEQNVLSVGARENIENRFEASPDERLW